MKEYVKSFVIGSSWLVFILFFIAVSSYNKTKIIKYSYDDYTKEAPFLLGCAAVFAKFIHLNYNISLRKSLFLTSLITFSIISTYITFWDLYKFKTNMRWYKQYLLVFIGHFIAFNIIVYNLEIYL